MMVMMKPDKQYDQQEEGNEIKGSTETHDGIKTDSPTTKHCHQRSCSNKTCDMSSLTIQSLKAGHICDASPEKLILSTSSPEEPPNPKKLCRYSYMDSASRSQSSSGLDGSRNLEMRSLSSCNVWGDSHENLSGLASNNIGDFTASNVGVNHEDTCIVLERSQHLNRKESIVLLSSVSQTLHDIPVDNALISSCTKQKNPISKEPSDLREPLPDCTFLTETSKPRINDLPRCILVHIFSVLSKQDMLTHAAFVCRLWYDISKDPDLWRHIQLEDSHEHLKICDSVLGRVTSLSDNIASILLEDCNLITDGGLASVVRKCSNLRELCIVRCSRLTDSSYTAIADHCPKLRVLNLSGSTGLTDVGLQKIACSCCHLEHVNLNQCTQITDRSVQIIAIKCANLKLITFQENEGVTDTSVEALATHCKYLESLAIHKCSLSTNGFFQLSRIPTLTKIDISNNKTVTPVAVKYIVEHCILLRSFNLCLCHSINDECVQHIAIHSKEIKKLLLVGCQITDEVLISLGQHATALEHLDVGWCEEITDKGVIAISKMCPKLNYLGLMRCDKVNDKTMLELSQQNSHILYSTFLLDSQRLIAQASQQGFVFKKAEEEI